MKLFTQNFYLPIHQGIKFDLKKIRERKYFFQTFEINLMVQQKSYLLHYQTKFEQL